MRSPEVARLVDEFFLELHFRYALCTISLLYPICIVSDYTYIMSDYIISDPHCLSHPTYPLSPMPSCEFLTECGWGHDIP
ncbi:hypothetical protein B484DRAFT_363622, partial [Ochromonadaceae sp. CCMP2298]